MSDATGVRAGTVGVQRAEVDQGRVELDPRRWIVSPSS
jgi:hypothetical protein